MIEPFLISDEQLRTLSATRQGRVSIAGYNYQAAYAVARLASMCMRQQVFDLKDWPQQLRYDWGEDLDEACDDGTVIFTQCKRVATIGQPASLANVLIGFSPKWLWSPESAHGRLRFRLVCSDPRFALGGTSLDTLKADVRGHFLTRLDEQAGQQSDRAVWITDAKAVGHEVLFEALWGQFNCLYLPADVADSELAGPRLAAEKEALRMLLEQGQIASPSQAQVLGRLRRLIHDNLITFDPANESLPLSFDRSPRRLDRADVNAAIDPWRPVPHRQPPFQLVDRTFLSEQRELKRQQFIARQPDWCDVVHGHDETIKFIERDQTDALKATVLDKVVARIGRAGKLPTLVVAGAPGDGKTTITRRVAALLVDAGKVLIADTGVGMREPPGEPDEYVQAIERLQEFGRPVILLLDDPLYAGSPWLDVLRKLNRPGLRIGVLAASPQFLLDEYKSQLLAYDLSTFKMARASQTEHESLATLYGRPLSSKAEEDFLVIAMEMAAGMPFREIINRLWLTLACGRDLSSAQNLSDLPWQTRAYLFVCFFSRSYEACPEALLLTLLEMSGGAPGATNVRIELQRLKHFAGWGIFRIGRRARTTWDYSGPVITAAHAKIARQSWDQRPLPWVDLADVIVEASISAPKTAHDISSLIVGLRSLSFTDSASGADGTELAGKLIERWGHEASVETLDLYNLSTPLIRFGYGELLRPLRETLTHRSIPSPQGWLAALLLLKMDDNSEKQQGVFIEVDLLSLIQSADFSIARAGATKFGQILRRDNQLFEAFVFRLLDALDRKLTWTLDAILLTYLLTIATPQQLRSHVSQINAWLEVHLDDTSIRMQHIRTQYVSLLQQTPIEFSNLREYLTRYMAGWQSEPQVLANYLCLLSELPDSQVALNGMAQIYEWQQFASDILNSATELTFRSGLQNHETLIKCYARLYLELLWSLNLHDSEVVRGVLTASHDAAEVWYKGRLSGPPPYLPLP